MMSAKAREQQYGLPNQSRRGFATSETRIVREARSVVTGINLGKRVVIVTLASDRSNGKTGGRYVGGRWDTKLPPGEAAAKAYEPAFTPSDISSTDSCNHAIANIAGRSGCDIGLSSAPLIAALAGRRLILLAGARRAAAEL
jgi:hypothetical protein